MSSSKTLTEIFRSFPLVAWDDIKLRVSISRLYYLYMQNNTILVSIYDEKIYIYMCFDI